jgi:hypothetical protein
VSDRKHAAEASQRNGSRPIRRALSISNTKIGGRGRPAQCGRRAIEQQCGDQLLCEIICQANCGAITREGLIKAIASP